jgi:transformation/transcription domain-associated protein
MRLHRHSNLSGMSVELFLLRKSCYLSLICEHSHGPYRFAARFLLVHYFLGPSGKDSASSVLSAHLSLVRRILFSRSLRLLPLPQQVGVVEGLSVLISQFPGILPSILPFSDTHVLAFLSELLKMLSVADGEMSDRNLEEFVVDRDGYAGAKTDSITSQYPTHSSSLFFRRECVIEVDRPRMKVAIPGEVPVGVQLRVSAIVLYHSVVRAYSDPFFDAETSSPIGTYRLAAREPISFSMHSHRFPTFQAT